jgi:hypothetical protein
VYGSLLISCAVSAAVAASCLYTSGALFSLQQNSLAVIQPCCMSYSALLLTLLLSLCLQEVKSLKSTIAKMESMARQKEALLADKTALVDRLQVSSLL